MLQYTHTVLAMALVANTDIVILTNRTGTLQIDYFAFIKNPTYISSLLIFICNIQGFTLFRIEKHRV